MDERETLIRVEQQLQDSIKNQSLILNDLKEIFSKIEIESKAIVSVKSDLNTHLEMTVVRRENTEQRYKEFESKIKEVTESFSNFQDDALGELGSLKDSIDLKLSTELDKLKKVFEEEKKAKDLELQTMTAFQNQLKFSYGLIKWILGAIIIVITTAWPIITFFLDKK